MKTLKNNPLGTTPVFWLYAGLLLAVYVFGLILPLFDNDSGHHALIGMHMYLTGDFVSLIDRGRDYLDKPHLLFWSAALGDYLLGVGTLAYKLPSFLVALFGVYATFRLGERLYSRTVGFNAALILVTTQAYILGLNDIRMDALLLSFIILATWTLYEFSLTNQYKWLVLGAFTMAMAFSTKGMSGAAVPVIAVGAQVLYSRNWSFVRSFRWLLAVVLFFVFSSPVIYAYYLQYDLHPEKVIRGMTDISGVAFILFFQNTERLEGTNWGSTGGSDPIFFFHTALWALLPWCLLAYWAVFRRGVSLWKERLTYAPGREILTFTIIVLMFTLLSFSNFKLPHYLNILFPFFAILVAAQLQSVTDSATGKRLLITQKFVVIVMVILVLIINFYLFPLQNWLVGLLAAVALVLLVRAWRSRQAWREKLLAISASVAIFANLFMNGNFYPQIQEYLSGIHLAAKTEELNIAPEDIRYYQWESNTFNYYDVYYHKNLAPGELGTRENLWLVGPKAAVAAALDSAGVQPGSSYTFLHFPITRLRADFLNPATRKQACEEVVLVQVGSGSREANRLGE